MKRTYVHNPRSCGPSPEVRAFLADLLGEEYIASVNAEVNKQRAARGSQPYDFSKTLGIRKNAAQ